MLQCDTEEIPELSELLVKKEQTIKEKAIKVLVIALIVLAAVVGILFTPIALVVAVVLGVAAYFLLPNLDLEFEYLMGWISG